MFNYYEVPCTPLEKTFSKFPRLIMEMKKKIVVMHPWLLCRVFSFSCTWEPSIIVMGWSGKRFPLVRRSITWPDRESPPLVSSGVWQPHILPRVRALTRGGSQRVSGRKRIRRQVVAHDRLFGTIVFRLLLVLEQ